MELSHWCFSSYNTWDVEAKFVNSLLKVDEDDVGEDLEAIPPSIYNYLAAIPDLTGVTHSWLWQFMLINFWL